MNDKVRLPFLNVIDHRFRCRLAVTSFQCVQDLKMLDQCFLQSLDRGRQFVESAMQ